MRLLIIDPALQSRRILLTRVEEAIRQTGLKRIEIIDGEFSLLTTASASDPIVSILLGPGCYENAEQAIQVTRGFFPNTPVALVLANEVYAEEAVELRRSLPVRIMAIADIPQLANFLLDTEADTHLLPAARNRGVISVVQLKGGVGASTIAAGLAACWARHDLTVALIDLDDVNPQLTEWSNAGTAQRRAVAELLRVGEVPRSRLSELYCPIDGFNERLVVIPQPELYHEAFHFKADVLENAPSSSVYIEALIGLLRDEFDVIVVDSGRSWGIASFGLLPLSQHVLLVTDDDSLSVRRSIENLQRFVRESGDEEEFDLSTWSVVLNAHTGKLLSAKDVRDELREATLLPENSVLYSIPFSDKGRRWGEPGESFFDLADSRSKQALAQLALALIPFRQERGSPLYGVLRRTLKRLTG